MNERKPTSNQKPPSANSLTSPNRQEGFTLLELVVVICGLLLLAFMALPALAKSKNRSPAAGCLSNLRQLQAGASMYADDHNGVLMPNAFAGAGMSGWVPDSAGESWNSAGNTNVLTYTKSVMGAYLPSNVMVFRCPGDVVPSDNGVRLRSYSMNGTMGAGVVNLIPVAKAFASGWRIFIREADVSCLGPKNAFVF